MQRRTCAWAPGSRLVPLKHEDPFSLRGDRNDPNSGTHRPWHNRAKRSVPSQKEFQSMRVITVCVGSACHLKSSHEIINYFKEAMAEADLEGKVELKGALCMDQCTEGANLLIVNAGGKVCHQGGVIVYQLMPKEEAG